MKKIIGLKPGLSIDKALEMSYNDIIKSAAFIGTVMEDGRLRDEISGNIFTYREQIKAGGEAPADSREERDIIEIAAMLESVRFTVRIDGKSVKPDGSSVIPGAIDYTLPPQLSVDGIGYGVYICNLDLIIRELGMTLTDHGSFYSVTSAPSYSRRIGKKRLASGYLENAGRFSDVWSLCKEISGCNRTIMPLSNQSPKTWMVNLDVDMAKGPKNVEYEWYSVTESRGAELIDLDFAVHATLAPGDEVKVVKERDSIINYLGESCLKVIYHNTFRWVSEFEVKPKGAGEDNYFVGAIGTQNLSVRPSPSKGSGEVAKFAPGSKIKIVLPKTTQTEISTGITFIQVYYDGNKIGWVGADFVFPDKPVEFVVPAVVNYTHNGASKTIKPQNNWGLAGGGTDYSGKPLKENGRYRVAVAPKILRPNYPDNGEIKTDEFSGFDRNITIILEDPSGKIKAIDCVIVDFKAHSFNLYDGNGDKLSFAIDSGYVQTGIRYPEATNGLRFASSNIDGTVIEFCTDSASLDSTIKDCINNYKLVKVIALQ